MDVGDYNDELDARGQPTWHDVEWLYAECYLYRRIHTLFALSEHWKDYDVFNRQRRRRLSFRLLYETNVATIYKSVMLS